VGGRPDFRRDLTLRPDQLHGLVQPLASCISGALLGRPFTDDLDRARAAVTDFRTLDHTRVASVLRRPLHRMVQDLQDFARAEPGSTRPQTGLPPRQRRAQETR
jgi:hypothetical protein